MVNVMCMSIILPGLLEEQSVVDLICIFLYISESFDIFSVLLEYKWIFEAFLCAHARVWGGVLLKGGVYTPYSYNSYEFLVAGVCFK